MSRVEETRDELIGQLVEIQAKIQRIDLANATDSVSDHATRDNRRQAAFSEDHSDSPGSGTKNQFQTVVAVELDHQLIVRRWPECVAMVTGWSASDTIGKHWGALPFSGNETLPGAHGMWRDLTDGGKEFCSFTTESVSPDGKSIHCEWLGSAVRDGQGKLTAIVSFVQDLTTRVQAQQQTQHVRNAMRLIVEGTARHTGSAFFEALASQIGEALGVRHAIVSQIDTETGNRADMLAFWSGGRLVEKSSYELAGTPCDQVIDLTTCLYPDNVQTLFPDDVALVDMGARSYLGTPLISSSGEALGLLAVIDDQPMEDRSDIRQIVALFADRAAIELERMRIEKARRENEIKLRILTDQLPAILWTTDQKLSLTLTTGAGLARLDRNKQRWTGKTLHELFPSHGNAIAAHQRALQGTSETLEIERWGRTFEVHVEPLRDRNDKIVGTIGVARDVSDFRRVEQSLVASEERFRKLVVHAPEAVVLFDVETANFVMVNPSAERLYGLSSDELCKRGPIEMSPPFQPDGQSSAEKANAVIGQACAGQTPIFEWTHQDSNGKLIPCEIRLLALDDNGRTLIRGSITDISEAKRAEESLRRMETDLAHVARVSTMGEMVGGLAHELNQPLYAIQNFGKACSNLLDDAQSVDREQLHDWLGKITSTAEYAGQILMRLRNFVSREPFNKVVVNLDELFESALMLTKHDARNSGIQIEYSTHDSLPQVKADAVQIQQVLVNLLRNAFDAMENEPTERRRVLISTELHDDTVAVTVADRGPGLPAGHVNIFDAFRSTKSTGLGLGLAIAKTIVEAHQGTLTAENREGGGAVFRFTLPRETSPVQESVLP